jgi:hypothetical protein
MQGQTQKFWKHEIVSFTDRDLGRIALTVETTAKTAQDQGGKNIVNVPSTD